MQHDDGILPAVLFGPNGSMAIDVSGLPRTALDLLQVAERQAADGLKRLEADAAAGRVMLPRGHLEGRRDYIASLREAITLLQSGTQRAGR